MEGKNSQEDVSEDSYLQSCKNLEDMLKNVKFGQLSPSSNEIIPHDEELFCENNLDKPLIAAYCYKRLYELNKNKTIELINKNKLYISTTLLGAIIDLNWIKDFMLNGVRIIIDNYHFNDNKEESSMDIIIGDFKLSLIPEGSIINRIDEYLIENPGGQSPFERSFKENLEILEEFKRGDN